MTRGGKVVNEFSDGANTYAIIDGGRYVEVALILVNYDKKDGSIVIEVG